MMRWAELLKNLWCEWMRWAELLKTSDENGWGEQNCLKTSEVNLSCLETSGLNTDTGERNLLKSRHLPCLIPGHTFSILFDSRLSIHHLDVRRPILTYRKVMFNWFLYRWFKSAWRNRGGPRNLVPSFLAFGHQPVVMQTGWNGVLFSGQGFTLGAADDARAVSLAATGAVPKASGSAAALPVSPCPVSPGEASSWARITSSTSKFNSTAQGNSSISQQGTATSKSQGSRSTTLDALDWSNCKWYFDWLLRAKLMCPKTKYRKKWKYKFSIFHLFIVFMLSIFSVLINIKQIEKWEMNPS